MVTEISKKIAQYRKSYNELVKNAEAFFEQYPQDYKKLTLLKHKVKTYQAQIEHIESYRKEKGKYPAIKGHTSGQRYLAKLVAQQSNSDKELSSLQNRLQKESNQRYEHLDHLTDHLLDMLNGERIFSQFLGTIILSAPSPEEKVRHVRNEKNKPIFVTALVIALFEQVRHQHKFSNKFMANALEQIFGGRPKFDLMADKIANGVSAKAMPAELKVKYREDILKPLAKAALLQSIGLHSPEANNLLGGDRFRKLDHDERGKLLDIIDSKTSIYLKLGIGIPNIRFTSKEHRDAFLSREKKQLGFTLKILSSLKKKSDELGDLIRIPMTYASFLLSTKQDAEYTQIYDAYDILADGKERGSNKSEFIDAFLKMVGRFPLGSGLYVIQQSTGEIERAIVSSLYPDDHDEPIVKIITRRQIQFLSQAEVVVSKATNLYFEESRKACHYEPEYLQKRYRQEFTWNATEVWEVQLPAIEFWKKDGKRIENGVFNPDSY